MDFIELARSRYSCKSFDSRQISKEQLDCILEAGRLASTANHNSRKPIEETVTYL
jgi:nitroreductase